MEKLKTFTGDRVLPDLTDGEILDFVYEIVGSSSLDDCDKVPLIKELLQKSAMEG